MGNDGYTQVTQVGEEFNPGSEGNVAIAELLGFEAEVKDDGEAYIFDAENTLGPKWVRCPDYCGDAATAAELMEFENRVRTSSRWSKLKASGSSVIPAFSITKAGFM